MAKKEGGWGWVIVCACFINGFLYDGTCIGYSYGLIYIEFLEEFNESKALTAGIGSVMFGMSMIGPVAGMFANRYGCRVTTVAAGIIFAVGYISSAFSTGVIYLFFSLGLLLGMGFVALNLTRTVIIVQYFDKRRSLARGISVCGSGIGTIVFNPLSRWLIDEYGWRGTLLIEGGLALNIVVCGLLMRPFTSTAETEEHRTQYSVKDDDQLNEHASNRMAMAVEETHEHTAQETGEYVSVIEQEPVDTSEILLKKITGVETEQTTKAKTINTNRWLDISVFKRPSFLVVFFSTIFLGMASMAPFTFLPAMVVSSGWTRFQATWLMSVIGITSTAARVPLGFAMDGKCVNKILAYVFFQVTAGVSVAAMPFCQHYSTLMVACVIFGCLTIGYIVLVPLVSADLFGEKLIADTNGLCYVAFGIGNFLVGPITGAIVDATGSYKLAFIAFGSAFALSGVFYIPMYKSPTKKK